MKTLGNTVSPTPIKGFFFITENNPSNIPVFVSYLVSKAFHGYNKKRRYQRIEKPFFTS